MNVFERAKKRKKTTRVIRKLQAERVTSIKPRSTRKEPLPDVQAGA